MAQWKVILQLIQETQETWVQSLVGKILWSRIGTPLCLENSMARGAWRATVHGVRKSQIQLSDSAYMLLHTHSRYVYLMLIRVIMQLAWGLFYNYVVQKHSGIKSSSFILNKRDGYKTSGNKIDILKSWGNMATLFATYIR